MLLARRARHSDGAVLRRLLCRRLQRRPAEDHPSAGDSFAATATICCRSTRKRSSKTSPIFNYPYSYTREALEQAKARNEWDACHGLKLKFSNPETGDFAMPTIGTFIQLLPKGFKTARYRSTDATVFAAIEGKGRTRIGEQTFEWGPRDLFVVPSWHWVTHEAEADAVLFSFSDRPVQQKLDLFREDRGNA
jgi:gentisate 1,2-dioxygenase